MEQSEALQEVLSKYAVPDPKIVGKLPRGGIQLSFVGHADITRILIEIDPLWRWVPTGWVDGRPAIHIENGMATMWGELTLLGHARLGVGSVPASKPDLDKELVSDFLRNAAMRFGVCLSLWTKQEWDDLDTNTSSQSQERTVSQKKPLTPAAAPVQVGEQNVVNGERAKIGSAAKPAKPESTKKENLDKTVHTILEKFDTSSLVVGGPDFDERTKIAATWGAWPLVKGIAGLAARGLGIDPPEKLIEICNKEILWAEVNRLINLRKSPK